MDQEALEILEMVRGGKISAEQGAQLLEALKNPPPAALAPTGKPRFIRVRVNVKEKEGKTKRSANSIADLFCSG